MYTRPAFEDLHLDQNIRLELLPSWLSVLRAPFLFLLDFSGVF